MPFGSVFSKSKTFEAETADGQRVYLKNNFLSRMGLKVLGMPHIGLRLRAKKILEQLPKKIDFLLDAGCGTGIYSFSLAKRAKRIYALDISREKIEYLKKENSFKNIKFEAGDLSTIKFPEGKFQIIICSDVLEHIKKDWAAFKNIAKSLAPEGKFIITVPFDSKKNKDCYKLYGHERSGYTIEDIKKLARENDLKIVFQDYYSYPLADKISEWSYGFIKNPAVLAMLFYQLYWAALLGEKFKKGEPNGLLVVLRKI